MAGRFGPRRTYIKTSGSNLTESNFYSLSGLNFYSPDELMKDNESPYGRNFRIFQEDDLEARVAISKRRGHSCYSVPIGETLRGSYTTDNGLYHVGSVVRIAQNFTVSAAGRLTKAEVNI